MIIATEPSTWQVERNDQPDENTQTTLLNTTTSVLAHRNPPTPRQPETASDPRHPCSDQNYVGRWLAWADSQIVGAVTLERVFQHHPGRSTWLESLAWPDQQHHPVLLEISGLLVHPDQEGNSLGQELVKTAAQAAYEIGCIPVTAAPADNARSHTILAQAEMCPLRMFRNPSSGLWYLAFINSRSHQ